MQLKLLIAISTIAYFTLVTALPITEESSETTTITATTSADDETTTQNQEVTEIPQTERNSADDDAKPKKSVRNYPIYYVDSKVNGKFGKSVRAFTSGEFTETFPAKNSN